MKRHLPTFLLSAGLAAMALFPEQGLTDERIVGFRRYTCETDGSTAKDTVVSVPFRRDLVYEGLIAEVAVESGDQSVTLPNLAPGFGDSFFDLVVIEGNAAGYASRIDGQNDTTLSLSSVIPGLSAGDRVRVVPVWTLDTLLPPATQTAVHESTGLLPSQRGTEVLFFDQTSEGIDLAPDRIFFLNGGVWKEAGGDFPDAGDTVIEAGMPFIVRHPAGAVETYFIAYSNVVSYNSVFVLNADRGEQQDNVLSLLRPVPVALADLDIAKPAFIDSKSDNPAHRKDELIVFGEASGDANAVSKIRYFRTPAGWRRDDDGVISDASAAVLPAGPSLIVRKGPFKNPSVIWTNSANY